MSKLIAFVAVATLGVVGVMYAEPAAVTWYQTHRAQAEIQQAQALYDADVKQADSDMGNEIQAAHIERDNKIAAARATRDVAVRQIRAAYPQATLPRAVAISAKGE